MSRWECGSGHVLEGFFYAQLKNGDSGEMPVTVGCPYCSSDMVLAREEGARELLKRIREFVGEVSQHPDYTTHSSDVLKDLGRLETTVKKLADEASRP